MHLKRAIFTGSVETDNGRTAQHGGWQLKKRKKGDVFWLIPRRPSTTAVSTNAYGVRETAAATKQCSHLLGSQQYACRALVLWLVAVR